MLASSVQAPAAVAALLARLGLSADDRVRVEVNGGAPGGAAAEVRPAGSGSSVMQAHACSGTRPAGPAARICCMPACTLNAARRKRQGGSVQADRVWPARCLAMFQRP